MQPVNLLVLATSCLFVLVYTETQSAHTASSEFGASNAPQMLAQQQQQQQPSFRPRNLHLASNHHSLNGDNSNNNVNPYYFTSSYEDTSQQEDYVSSFSSSDANIGDDKDLLSSDNEQLKESKSSNYIDNNMHDSLKLVSESSKANKLSKDIYNYEDNSIPLQGHSQSNNKQNGDHHIDKREAASSFLDGGTEANYIGPDGPIYLDRRYQVYMPVAESISSPYLSAQEYRNTFRRSDPYVIGKRATGIFSEEEMRFPGIRRGAPMFVGRRDAPYFVGKRAYSEDLDTYLKQLASGEDYSPLLADRRAAPKFVGRRGAPFFVGKKAAPKFVGKRYLGLEADDGILLPVKDLRAAPKFVGRRDASYFVNKRENANFPGTGWNDHSAEDELNWFLENQNVASKFVGRRGAPYFVGKRKSPMFVGKRRSGPIDFDVNDNEFPLIKDDAEVGHIEKRSVSSQTAGHVQGEYVAKRSVNTQFHHEDHSSLEEKRKSPKFVGRRGSPYFVGKRLLPNLDDNEIESVNENYESQILKDMSDLIRYEKGDTPFTSDNYEIIEEQPDSSYYGQLMLPLLNGKRRAPKFVGRRGAPKFVGKRLAPKFIGKRIAPKFIGKRIAPKFIGKRIAPKFVGKRDLHSLEGQH